MRALVQRVKEASVKVDGKEVGSIKQGLLVLIGFTHGDDVAELEKLCKKICGSRIFNDAEGKMNLSLKDIDGELLLVSQFTLYANNKKGNRPSFVDAAKPDIAQKLYDLAINQFGTELGKSIETGQFGADMKVSLTNDGPVTIMFEK